MKRNLLITAAILAASTLINFKASAQTTATGTVTATINISDVYAITMSGTGPIINYTTQPDFVDNRSVSLNQFTVFSNRRYKIDVKAANAFRIGSATTNVIPSNTMQVAVNTPTAPTNTTYTPRFLTAVDQTLINNAPGAYAEVYNLTYSIPSVANIFSIPAGAYTTDITYTLTQQ